MTHIQRLRIDIFPLSGKDARSSRLIAHRLNGTQLPIYYTTASAFPRKPSRQLDNDDRARLSRGEEMEGNARTIQSSVPKPRTASLVLGSRASNNFPSSPISMPIYSIVDSANCLQGVPTQLDLEMVTNSPRHISPVHSHHFPPIGDVFVHDVVDVNCAPGCPFPRPDSHPVPTLKVYLCCNFWSSSVEMNKPCQKAKVGTPWVPLGKNWP